MELNMIIERAHIEDTKEILDFQKLAYQSEAEIYNDYTIPPLTQTLEEMEPHGQARGPQKPYPPTPRLRWVIRR
jgi:hypothetical protein